MDLNILILVWANCIVSDILENIDSLNYMCGSLNR